MLLDNPAGGGVDSYGAAAGPACTTQYQEQCSTVQEQQCSTQYEQVPVDITIFSNIKITLLVLSEMK